MASCMRSASVRGFIGVTIVVTAVNIERIEIAPILAYVTGW
jgi:hypothetical protein